MNLNGILLFLFAACSGAATASSPVGRLFALDSRMIRGAAPSNPEEFRFLRDIGVGTIISFDRRKPDFAMAESLGMRYVHIPIGYGAIPENAVLDFFATLKNPDLPPPFFIHCHGGKYRVGAMAAIYRMQMEHWDPDSAYAEMMRLGGKADYIGLNRTVKAFHPFSEERIARHGFDPAAKPPDDPLGKRMIDISKAFAEIKRFAGRGMEADELAGMALGLEESYLEIRRLQACPPCDSAGYGLFLDAAQNVRRERMGKSFGADWIQATQQDCRKCHGLYRK